MAIAYGEYGYYDTETGRTISNVGGDYGPVWEAFTSDVTPPVSYGNGSAPALQAAAVAGPEYSAGGDYYRIPTVNGARFNRGAGAQHTYDFYKKQPDGSWQIVDPGEHAEEATYFWAGVNAPQYVSALQKAEDDRTALDAARLAQPGAIGQALTRSESSLTGGGNEDDARQELAFYSNNPATVSSLSDLYTPEMRQQIQQQISGSTPAAQASRDTDDGFGDLMKLAMLAAAIYSGGASLGAWGGAAGVGEAGALAAADAMAGIGASEFGAGLGALSAGEAAALAAGDAMAGAIPAGELAAWTGATGAGAGAGALSAADLAATDAMAGAIPAGEVGAWTGAAAEGAYPWLDAAGNLDVDAFLQATAPGGEYAGAIPGGAEGIAGMDTLGSTSWLESAANSLAHGDTSWLTQNITPSQVKSVISKLTGGSTATPRTGTRTGTAAAGALGGILPIVADSGPSGIESVLAANADARKSADAFAQAMAQSGKGV